MFVDIDSFKKINDNYGHNNGDRAIKAVADLLTNSMDLLILLCAMEEMNMLLYFYKYKYYRSTKVAQRICKNINTTYFLEPINLSLRYQ